MKYVLCNLFGLFLDKLDQQIEVLAYFVLYDSWSVKWKKKQYFGTFNLCTSPLLKTKF